MVQLSYLLAGLALALTTSAAPLTVPLGSTGQTLTISADGKSITVGGQTVSLSQAMSSAASCSTKKKSSHHGHQGKGAGAASGKGGAAANSTAAETTNAKAIYFMTNAANNSIVALNVAADGTLSDGSITATGGAGMNGIENGAPAAPDALFSQGAVKVAGSVTTPQSSSPISTDETRTS
jgi:hypothetical protein